MLGIGWYLYQQIDWNHFFRLVRGADVVWVLVAVLCYGLTTATGIVRWQVLLQSCRANLAWTRTVQLTFIGLFANLFLPSSMGGDLFKGFYASREVSDRKATVIMSIIMERLLGLVAMFLISTTLICTRFDALTREPATRIAVYLYFLFFFIILVVVLLGTWHKVGDWIPFWKKLPIGDHLREAGEAYRFFLRHPGSFWGGLALSGMAHFILMGSFYFVSRSLNMNIDFWDLAAVLPLIMVVSMIPVTPNGIGLRELAFAHFLQFANMTEEASVALSLAGTMIVYGFALFGGVVFLKFRAHRKAN